MEPEINEQNVNAGNSKNTADVSIGRPFVAGKSGNPSGRPKRTPEELELIAACKEKSPAALEAIENLMLGAKNETVRLQAAIAILDRAYGKPTQAHEVSGKNGGALEFAHAVQVYLPHNFRDSIESIAKEIK